MKRLILAALVALLSTAYIGNANASEPCKISVNPAFNVTTNAGFGIGIVIGNQRYVPAFIGVVNETYVSYRLVRDPRTGALVRVPVVLNRQFAVQVYYDRVTNVYFYLNQFGNPVPYLGLRPF